jgi:hypothetical protein
MREQHIQPGLVLSRIWVIYRDNAAVLIATAFALFAVQFVALLLLSGASIAVGILFFVLNVLYQGMVVELVRGVQNRRRSSSVGELLRSVEPVLLQLMAVSVLFGLGVALGFVLLIIPGLILLVMWSVVAPVTVLERPGVLAAFARSRELVRGNGWPVFGVILSVGVTVFAVALAAGLASAALGSLGGALLQWAVTAAIAPVSALSASVIYFALQGQLTAPAPGEGDR